jgi:hypothetical protein
VSHIGRERGIMPELPNLIENRLMRFDNASVSPFGIAPGRIADTDSLFVV